MRPALPPIAAALLLASTAAAQSLLGPVPTPNRNPTTAEKAVLGKVLFWDEQLSSSGATACGTCHIPSAGGSDPRIGASALHPGPDGLPGTADDATGSPGVRAADAFGHYVAGATFGLDVQVTARRAPSVHMSAYAPELFWDGRAGDKFVDPWSGVVHLQSNAALETQSLVPLVSDIEMSDGSWTLDDLVARLEGVRPLALATAWPADVTAALAAAPDYPSLFARAFGTPEITPRRIAYALASYQRTLVPDDTPYDRFIFGDPTALTAQELAGYVAFNGAPSCSTCHPEPAFTNHDFHAVALRPSAEDTGRFGVTGNPADLGKFRTPSLRNVALRDRWFHNGSPDMTTLRDTVAFYDGAGAFDNLDPVLNAVALTAQEIDDITAFLGALTDPRAAAELPPFDRPTLRSERTGQNPMPLGYGAAPGAGGVVPRAIVDAAPFAGAERYRIGVENARGDALAVLRLSLVDLGGFAGAGGAPALRAALAPQGIVRTEGQGPGGGWATAVLPLDASPAWVGVTLDAQWWIRDDAAPGHAARTEVVRLTVE